MAATRVGVRLFALSAGLGVILGGAYLFAKGPDDDDLVGNRITKTYHKTSCDLAKAITAKNKIEIVSVGEANFYQLKPCAVCKPAGDPPPKKGDDSKSKEKDKEKAPKKDDPPATSEAPQDGAMKPAEKPAAGVKSKRSTAKGLSKKGTPAPTDEAKTDAADGAMKADPSMAKGKGKRSAGGKSAAKKADAKSGKADVAADDKAVKFSRDIAPILAGNCVRCHNAQQKRGQFDLSTFDKLIAGAAKEKVIVPGKPDESELILRIRGESTGPKMPPGQNNLAPETVAKIEEWVKAGALLDRGIDSKAALETIAPTPEALRKAAIAKLSPEQRDKKLEESALERWKKASAKAAPETTPGKNFQLFSNLPKDRAERLLKTMEGQRTALGNLLGPASGALSGAEKISLYVFKDLPTYVEFCRSVENREVEQGIEAHGRLDVEQPYLAAVDPLNGAEESIAPAGGGGASKKSARTKKGQAAEEPVPDGPDRTLAGLVSEQLASSAAVAGGKPPRWLVFGLGAYFGSRVDPRGSNYYRKLHEKAGEQFTLGWVTKANESLGNEGEPETIRGMGLTLCEWQAATLGPRFPMFVQGLIAQGGDKLDDVIRACFGPAATREQFLEQWGAFVASRYVRRR